MHTDCIQVRLCRPTSHRNFLVFARVGPNEFCPCEKYMKIYSFCPQETVIMGAQTQILYATEKSEELLSFRWARIKARSGMQRCHSGMTLSMTRFRKWKVSLASESEPDLTMGHGS